MIASPYGSEQAVHSKTLARNLAMRTFGTYDLGARVRYAAVRRELRRAPDPDSILDVGCGEGLLCFAMRRRWPDASIVGIDLEDRLIDHCRTVQGTTNYTRPIEFVAAEGVPNRAFSLVTCVDVLEHVEDDAAFVKRLFDETAPGGTLVLHTPVETKRRFLAEFEEQHDHVRDGYTREGLESVLLGAGYSSVRSTYTFGAMGAIAWEGFALARGSSVPAKAALPFWYLLSALDAMIIPNAGNGLLAVARRAD